jgi:hypothetical protein
MRPEIRVQSVLLVIGKDDDSLLKEESRYGLLCDMLPVPDDRLERRNLLRGRSIHRVPQIPILL